MAEASARRAEPIHPEALDAARLSRADRRDALLDAAVALVTSGDVSAVSMEAVAEHAGVSRPLVYKHFANRGELLAAVYKRESALLHAELSAEVVIAQHRRAVDLVAQLKSDRAELNRTIKAWESENIARFNLSKTMVNDPASA